MVVDTSVQTTVLPPVPELLADAPPVATEDAPPELDVDAALDVEAPPALALETPAPPAPVVEELVTEAPTALELEAETVTEFAAEVVLELVLVVPAPVSAAEVVGVPWSTSNPGLVLVPPQAKVSRQRSEPRRARVRFRVFIAANHSQICVNGLHTATAPLRIFQGIGSLARNL
jgi:hypothetical protein